MVLSTICAKEILYNGAVLRSSHNTIPSSSCSGNLSLTLIQIDLGLASAHLAPTSKSTLEPLLPYAHKAITICSSLVIFFNFKE